jgi:hypothetical protein
MNLCLQSIPESFDPISNAIIREDIGQDWFWLIFLLTSSRALPLVGGIHTPQQHAQTNAEAPADGGKDKGA